MRSGGQRQEQRHDRQLTAFHADVEAHQRKHQRIARQAELGEHAGKSKAVDEAEAEGDQPAPALDEIQANSRIRPNAILQLELTALCARSTLPR